MVRHKALICAALLLLSLSEPIVAREKITLFGTAIPGMFDENEPGPYNILYNRIATGVNAEIVLTMLPIRRATQIFSARGADCMFLGSPDPVFYTEFGMIQEEIIHSDTVMKVALKVYGPVGSKPIEEQSELNSINFAVDAGVGDVSYLKDIIPQDEGGVLFSRNLVDGFKLLDQRRVSALIAVDIDVRTLQAKDPKYSEYSVSDSFVLRQTEDVFVCRKSPRTVKFIEQVNQKTDELRRTGLLDDVFEN